MAESHALVAYIWHERRRPPPCQLINNVIGRLRPDCQYSLQWYEAFLGSFWSLASEMMPDIYFITPANAKYSQVYRWARVTTTNNTPSLILLIMTRPWQCRLRDDERRELPAYSVHYKLMIILYREYLLTAAMLTWLWAKYKESICCALELARKPTSRALTLWVDITDSQWRCWAR